MKSVNTEKLNRENFRSMLDSLSMPGTTGHLNKLFDSYTLSLASVVLYSEVSYSNETQENFSLIDAIANSQKADSRRADYVFTDNLSIELFQRVKKGNYKNPDFSATIIVVCDSLDGLELKLSGPGIDGVTQSQYPVSDAFVQAHNEQHKQYPLGSEIFFLDRHTGALKALSRTSRLEVA